MLLLAAINVITVITVINVDIIDIIDTDIYNAVIFAFFVAYYMNHVVNY